MPKAPILVMIVTMIGIGASVKGEEPGTPLQPLDLSSPRATIKVFLDSTDKVSRILADEYLPAPSQATYQRLQKAAEIPTACLDLSEVPHANKPKSGRAAAIALYEALNRISLPPLEEIPDLAPLPPQMSETDSSDEKSPAAPAIDYWVIPGTEITLVKRSSPTRSPEYVFSAETVARAEEFRERTGKLPYLRPVPVENIRLVLTEGTGWLIPSRWVNALPAWLRAPLGSQPAWKWAALIIILGSLILALKIMQELSRRNSGSHPFLRALAQACLPLVILLVTPWLVDILLVQVNFFGNAGSVIGAFGMAIQYLAGAWICWRLAPVVAEAIIASPHIPTESVDAHLIRICARLFGIVAGAFLLATGADRLGMPVYGIVAGLGVGGLAIALAAQPSIENLIGGLSLFADKPLRVGDFCRYGEESGTVESIGIRSTRIRGLDRLLTTIPNAALSKMPVTNFTMRDKSLIQTVMGVRYETGPGQLRHLLSKLYALLVNHPKIEGETARVRFVGFGASSLDIEIFAYATTEDWSEFLAVREDVFLQVMDVVSSAGASFAFPSQTLYLGRDRQSDPRLAKHTETETASPGTES